MTDVLNEKQREAILGQRARRGGSAGATRSPPRSSISPRAEAAYVTGQTLHVNGGMAMI